MKPELQFDAAEAPLVRDYTSELERLVSFPVNDSVSLDEWYRRAAAFREITYSRFRSLYDRLPHELEHYLDDADIRLKDAGYKAVQDEFITNLLLKLRTAASKSD
ncbi:MAG: hypothetical protein HZA32_07720 [Opitutae bacterium]|nr:hypothetical protein [Opitutae bacterium]